MTLYKDNSYILSIMTYYWDSRFIRHLRGDIKTIIEVGARYGDESIELSNCFPDAHIY